MIDAGIPDVTSTYRLLMNGLMRSWVSRTYNVEENGKDYIRCILRKCVSPTDRGFVSDLHNAGWVINFDSATSAMRASCMTPVGHDVHYHIRDLTMTFSRECTDSTCNRCVQST